MKTRKGKIEVYLTDKHKDEIRRKAEELDLSLSEYMRLKALDLLKENKK